MTPFGYSDHWDMRINGRLPKWSLQTQLFYLYHLHMPAVSHTCTDFHTTHTQSAVKKLLEGSAATSPALLSSGAAAPLSWLTEHRSWGTRSRLWASPSPAAEPAPLRPWAGTGPEPHTSTAQAGAAFPLVGSLQLSPAQPWKVGRQPWQGPEPPLCLPAWPSTALRSHRGRRDLVKGSSKKARLSAQLPHS